MKCLRRDKKGRFLGWVTVPFEVRAKISKAHKGKKLSEETKKKLSEIRKGRVPWNKGLTRKTDERVRRNAEAISKARKGVGIIKPILKPSQNLAYLLGVLKGDGWVGYIHGRGTGLIELKSKTKAFALSFFQSLKSIGLHPRIRFDPKLGSKGIWCVAANSRIFVDWYKSLNLKNIENLIQEYEEDFIRGFYEAEGSISYPAQSTIHIYNTDLDLLRFVQVLLKKIGFKSKMSLARKGSQKWRSCYQLYFCDKSRVQRFITKINPAIKAI